MDELFRRRENVRTWPFPAFAKDRFTRRLRAAEFHSSDALRRSSLSDALGSSPKPQERAAKYASHASGVDLIKRELEGIENLPIEWRNYIEQESKSDILSA